MLICILCTVPMPNDAAAAIRTLETRVITPALLPLVFPADPGAPLPAVAVENQIDGVRTHYGKLDCQAIAVTLKALVAAQDTVMGRAARRRIEYAVGKYGMAQDGRHGDHDARKAKAIEIVVRLLECGHSAAAEAALAFLRLDVGDTRRGFKIDDLCDAKLIAMQRGIDLASEPGAVLPLLVSGWDIGTRNFAYCLLEMVALVPPAVRGEPPDVVYRIRDWALFDLAAPVPAEGEADAPPGGAADVPGGAADRLVQARFTPPADAAPLAPRYDDLRDVLTALRSVRKEEARVRRNAKKRAETAARKRKREASQDDVPVKKTDDDIIDLVNL
jgi:hypothetical protein